MRILLMAIMLGMISACVSQDPLQGNYLELSKRNIIERDLTLPYGVGNPNLDRSEIAVPENESADKNINVNSKGLSHL